jgi:catechol 2,3-dioxygenase-like lactoylglutathione lyase family enzyme
MIHAFNHAGLSVTNLDDAIAWYHEVFGLRLIRGPLTLDIEEPDSGPPADIFGPQWKRARVAHLSTANGVGIELFEFNEPPAERRVDNFEYWRTGIFHIAFTCPDVEEVALRLERYGGKQRSQLHEVAPGCIVCYCEDPFGNILELVNRSYEQVNANRND